MRVGDLNALESEIATSDSESGVNLIEPDPTPLQETTTQQLLRPPVVAQTRPMEDCHAAVPRGLRRGRDVQTTDDAVAVDARQVSATSDTVVSQKKHRKSECVATVVPKLAAAPQANYEVVQPRPPDYGYTNSLPPGSRCLDLPRIHTPEGSPPAEIRPISHVTDILMEMTGGSPPAEIYISRGPGMLQISVTATEIAGGSPPADIDIYVVADIIQTEISVMTRYP